MSETNTFSTIPGEEGKPETDADAICRQLEARLENERAAWQRARQQQRTIRMAGLTFLSLFILGALAVLYYISWRAAEGRREREPSAISAGQ